MVSVTIPDDLLRYIGERAGFYGCTILEIKEKGRMVEITLDKDGGVTLEDCSRFNRDISDWLESGSTLTGNWTIDVCSPGLDRELKNNKDYVWASGKDVHVVTREPVGGIYDIYGVLDCADEKCINVIDKDGKDFQIDIVNIAKARLWPGK